MTINTRAGQETAAKREEEEDVLPSWIKDCDVVI